MLRRRKILMPFLKNLENVYQYLATSRDLYAPPENIEKTRISILWRRKILIHVLPISRRRSQDGCKGLMSQRWGRKCWSWNCCCRSEGLMSREMGTRLLGLNLLFVDLKVWCPESSGRKCWSWTWCCRSEGLMSREMGTELLELDLLL